MADTDSTHSADGGKTADSIVAWQHDHVHPQVRSRESRELGSGVEQHFDGPQQLDWVGSKSAEARQQQWPDTAGPTPITSIAIRAIVRASAVRVGRIIMSKSYAPRREQFKQNLVQIELSVRNMNLVWIPWPWRISCLVGSVIRRDLYVAVAAP
ncbi:MAG: hypothetical protein AAGJ40_10415 [Planctomycetota bacterium]